ncbi:hypothetical protein AB0B45_41060 [Nonomuraea sp. NPDC049152]|uniref:hypothetical protein n=1 Tax=Nonomuraea sp. NPDC049152 TaxID=3154350 RepID=UPI0033EB4877
MTAVPSEHCIYPDPRTVSLEFVDEGDDGRLGRMAARRAVLAISELSRDLLQPLEFGMTAHFMDEYGMYHPDDHPPHWHWYLQQTSPPAHVRPEAMYVDEKSLVSDVIDEPAMFKVVDQVLGQPCTAPRGRLLTWTEMYVRSARVRFPDTMRSDTEDHLVVDDYDNKHRGVRVPLIEDDNAVWIEGPRYPFLASPISCRVLNHGMWGLDLQLQVSLSVWWHDETPGRTLLDDALRRLHCLGWQQTYP